MLRLVASLTVALCALLPAAAEAHGPSRQKVVSKIEINAPVDKVWAVVGNFQDAGWIPGIKTTEGTGGNDVGATRKLTLENGGVVNEKLTKYSAEERGFAFEITDVDVKVLPVTNFSSQMNVTGTPEKTIVEWRAAFYRGFVNNDPPPELSDEAAVKAVTDMVQGGLGALKKKFEGG
jgi:hypothetical protein